MGTTKPWGSRKVDIFGDGGRRSGEAEKTMAVEASAFKTYI